jgi:hypothetical protein
MAHQNTAKSKIVLEMFGELLDKSKTKKIGRITIDI